MKKKPFIQELEKIQIPEVSTPLHQQHLKEALFMDQAEREPDKLIFNPFLSMKKLLPIGLLTVLAVAISLYGSQFFSSHTASAREMIEKAIEKVQLLQEQGANQPDLEQELEALTAALNSQDLSLEEDKDGDDKTAELSYTNEDGNKVMIKLHEDDEDPVDVEEQKENDENMSDSSETEDDSEDQEMEESSHETESINSESKSAELSDDKEGSEVSEAAEGEKMESAESSSDSGELKTEEAQHEEEAESAETETELE